MRLLLDSNVVIRMVTAHVDTRLARLLEDRSNDLLISLASVWELAIKDARYDLDLPPDFRDQLAARGCAWLPISLDHVWSVRSLPPHHGDPFDRLIVAQALAESLTLVTSDALLARYGVEVIRA